MRKVKQNGKNYRLISSTLLVGIKLAFLIESENTIYVSPAIYSLSLSDNDLIRKNVKVTRMPIIISQESKKNRFVSLKEWVDHLKEEKADIFCPNNRLLE